MSVPKLSDHVPVEVIDQTILQFGHLPKFCIRFTPWGIGVFAQGKLVQKLWRKQ